MSEVTCLGVCGSIRLKRVPGDLPGLDPFINDLGE